MIAKLLDTGHIVEPHVGCVRELPTYQPYEHLVEDGIYKEGVSDKIVTFLRRVVEVLLTVVTCGCFPGWKVIDARAVMRDSHMIEQERAALRLLLQQDYDILDENCMRSLVTLAYSDSAHLQQCAALFYHEWGNNHKDAIADASGDQLAPLASLLSSINFEGVVKTAIRAANTISFYNADALIECRAYIAIIDLMSFDNREISYAATATLARLATSTKNRHKLVRAGVTLKLLQLARKGTLCIRRNVIGSLLNLTMEEEAQGIFVDHDGMELLIELFHNKDDVIINYSVGILSNLAMNELYIDLIGDIRYRILIERLVNFLSSWNTRIKEQSSTALKNLSWHEGLQFAIVQLGALPVLANLVTSASILCRRSALVCARNMAMNAVNHSAIVRSKLIRHLPSIIRGHSKDNEQVLHAVGIVRNLARGEHLDYLIERGCASACIDSFSGGEHKDKVVYEELTQAIIYFVDIDVGRSLVLRKISPFLKSLTTVCEYSPKLRYTCLAILGQLTHADIIPEDVIKERLDDICLICRNAISDEATLHVGLWASLPILRDALVREKMVNFGMAELCAQYLDHSRPLIRQLATTVHQLLII